MTDEYKYNQIDRRHGPDDRREHETWYTNKELFEKIQEMNEKVTDKIDGIQKELTTTINDLQDDVRKYNNLNNKIESLVDAGNKNEAALSEVTEKLDTQVTKCNQINDKREGQRSIGQIVKDWWPILLATGLGISGLLKGCGAF